MKTMNLAAAAVLILSFSPSARLAAQPKPAPPARTNVSVAPKPAQPSAPAPPAPVPSPKAQPAVPVNPAPPLAHTASARALEGRVKGFDDTLAGDPGRLTISTSANHAAAPGVVAPRLLSAQLAHGAIIGQAGQTHAEASVATLDLTLGTHRVSAFYLAGRAEAFARGTNAAIAARSDIVGLVVDGQPVPAPARPDHRIWWKDGYLVLNEQTGGATGAVGQVTVTALRAVVKDLGEVKIGSATAGINATRARPCEQDFVAGSGWITMAQSRGPLHLAVAMMRANDGGLRGHLFFEDPSNNVRVEALGAREYAFNPARPGLRLIRGDALYNGTPGMPFRLELTDAGEPGSNDRFLLVLSNGYTAAGLLQGGNLRLLPCQ